MSNVNLGPKHNVKIFNLSSHNLTKQEISILKLGPKFVPVTPTDFEQTKIDILKFSRVLLLKANFSTDDPNDNSNERKSLINPVSNYIPKSVKSETLKSIVEDLEILANNLHDLSKKHVQDNLSKKQRFGLKTLKQNKNIVYFSADKGGGVVLLDSDFYCKLVLEKLNSPNFELAPHNMDHTVMLKVKSFVRKYQTCLTSKEKRAILNFDYKGSNFYGLPKIHKSQLIKEGLKFVQGDVLNLNSPIDLSLRIILGGKFNPTVNLADLLDEILKPYLPLVNSRVQDVFQFIERIPKFGTNDMPFIQMWSVDIKDMYPSLHKDLGLEAVSYWVDRYPTKLPTGITKQFILDALILVLENNYGFFNGNYYRQIQGTATGIKVAPTYADLIMGYLEIKFYFKLKLELGESVAQYFSSHYRRYLDDGQIMWNTKLGEFDQILVRMNEMHPAIHFISEFGEKSLNFLNITILKGNHGFTTQIFNKDTESDTYLPFQSCHPRHTKTNIPFGLAKNVRRLTDDIETAKIKLQELSEKLIRCGYPKGMVNSATSEALSLKKKEVRKNEPSEEVKEVIPFVHVYDPSLPQLFTIIKNLTARLFTDKCLRPIFEKYQIINSQKEPLSLGRQLQHSRFENKSSINSSCMVSKCNISGCKLCNDILQVDSLYFPNVDKLFEIKNKMDCNARNLIYCLRCKKCNQTYIGETVNFRARMSQHRSNSASLNNASMEVSRHLYMCGQGFWAIPIFKVKEDNKISRLVKEDRLIKMLRPDLNRDERSLLHLQVTK